MLSPADSCASDAAAISSSTGSCPRAGGVPSPLSSVAAVGTDTDAGAVGGDVVVPFDPEDDVDADAGGWTLAVRLAETA